MTSVTYRCLVKLLYRNKRCEMNLRINDAVHTTMTCFQHIICLYIHIHLYVFLYMFDTRKDPCCLLHFLGVHMYTLANNPNFLKLYLLGYGVSLFLFLMHYSSLLSACAFLKFSARPLWQAAEMRLAFLVDHV